MVIPEEELSCYLYHTHSDRERTQLAYEALTTLRAACIHPLAAPTVTLTHALTFAMQGVRP